MLRAVLFDLDNTLVDRDRAFHECLGAHFPDAEVRAELLRLDQHGRGERARLFEFWQHHSGRPMNQALFGQLLAARMKPDAPLIEALRSLANAVKLGVITNGSGETQRQKYLAAGFAEVFSPDHLWVSAEVGVAKPDPAIFLLAARSLGEPPEHCLFVGDHEPEDFIGATRAGMRARLVDRVLDAARLRELLNQEGIA